MIHGEKELLDILSCNSTEEEVINTYNSLCAGMSKSMAIKYMYMRLPEVKSLLNENYTLDDAINEYIKNFTKKINESVPEINSKPATAGFVNTLILCLVAQIAVFAILMVVLMIIK